MRSDKTIYKLTVADLQTVADDYIERKLTEEEKLLLIEAIGDKIDWYDAIQNSIIDLGIK